MTKNTSNRMKLGMFISIGIALFILVIYFIGERQQLFRSTFRLSGIFRDVAGLQAGNNVRFSGINVGTVDNIKIVSDSSVQVDILIDGNARKYIKKDAVASIGSEGLMGNKILVINPGTGGKSEIENNDHIATTQPMDLDVVMQSLKATLDNASHITNDLSVITKNIQSGKGTIGKLLMDQSMAQDFDTAIVNLKIGSAGLKSITVNAKNSFSENFDSTFVNLKEASIGLRAVVDKAKKSWLLWGF